MRGIFRALTSILIDSYVWISLGAAMMGAEITFIFKLAFPKELILLLFGGTLFTYQFHRWYTPSRLDFKSWQIFWMGLAVLLWLVGAMGIQHFSSFLYLLLSGVISLLYIIPFRGSPFSNGDRKSFRERKGLKLWIISITWVLSTVLLPASWYSETSGAIFTIALLVIERLCFIAAITIPFDIRDIYTDSSKLETYPQQFGMQKSKQLSFLLLTLGFSSLLGLFHLELLPLEIMIGLASVYIISLALIRKVQRNSSKWYFTIVLDGLTILHGLATLIAASI